MLSGVVKFIYTAQFTRGSSADMSTTKVRADLESRADPASALINLLKIDAERNRLELARTKVETSDEQLTSNEAKKKRNLRIRLWKSILRPLFL